jgi:hypothetical protein
MSEGIKVALKRIQDRINRCDLAADWLDFALEDLPTNALGQRYKPETEKAIADAQAADRRDFNYLIAELRRQSQELERAREAKDGAYSERNKLVSALSKLFPASLERHEDSDKTWEDDWRWIVFINLPTGQVTWHIHDSELPNFAHLFRICGRVWDGHTTEQKYERLAALTQPAPEKP